MKIRPAAISAATLLLSATALPAFAQRASENAVASADDAFGSTVGQERIGIYSDTDVRGFSPLRAGNLRIEGVYFDQQGGLTGRVRAGSRIRVGVAAVDYPFPAPSGIVDYQLRSSGDKPVTSVAMHLQNYGGENFELDLSRPIIPGRISVAAGVTRNHDDAVDGAHATNYGVGVIPRFRFTGGETSLMFSWIGQRGVTSKVVIAAPGAFLPPMPRPTRYLGQEWARGVNDNINFGILHRQELGPAWSLRAGLFDSIALKRRGFSEIFTVADSAGNARHTVVADPRLITRSVSGEAVLTWRHDTGPLRQRVLFNLRGRDKIAQSGGSDRRDLGPVVLGGADPEAQPTFAFGDHDTSGIRQLTGGLGYMARYSTFVQVNAGLQKTSYRASFQRGALETTTRDTPWLYNATLLVSPSDRVMIYAGTVRGLEESGVAPENAVNRNETLPASRTTQYDGGVRVRLGAMRLVASAFQIDKPYFSFDAANRYEALGDVRHRGAEASISGPVGKRLTLIGGALLMKPEVTGEARTLGRVGPRPVGVAAQLLRMDAEYRTRVEGLSMTTSAVYTGRRAASARPYAELGGKQLFAPAFATFDIGARYRFKAQGRPMSARVVFANIFDNRSWRIAAANSYQLNDSRRLSLSLFADF